MLVIKIIAAFIITIVTITLVVFTIQMFQKEVFYYDGAVSNLSDAKKLAEDYGSLATLDQLTDYYNNGGQSCSIGWYDDGASGTSAVVVQTSNVCGCGSPGVCPQFGEIGGVWVYGAKPAYGTDNIGYFYYSYDKSIPYQWSQYKYRFVDYKFYMDPPTVTGN